jgi:hypothetical protein
MRRDGAPWSHHYRNMRPTTERKRMQTPRKTTIVCPSRQKVTLVHSCVQY